MDDKDFRKLLDIVSSPEQAKKHIDGLISAKAEAQRAIAEKRILAASLDKREKALDEREVAVGKREADVAARETSHEAAAAHLHGERAKFLNERSVHENHAADVRNKHASLDDREGKLAQDRAEVDALKAEYTAKLSSLRSIVS